MKWFEKIEKYFNAGLWSVEMVRNAVTKGKITPAQFTQITGENY